VRTQRNLRRQAHINLYRQIAAAAYPALANTTIIFLAIHGDITKTSPPLAKHHQNITLTSP